MQTTAITVNILKEFNKLKNKEKELGVLDKKITHSIRSKKLQLNKEDRVNVINFIDKKTMTYINVASTLRKETRKKRCTLNHLLNEQKKPMVQRIVLNSLNLTKEKTTKCFSRLPYIHYIKLSKYKNRISFRGSFANHWYSKKTNAYFGKGCADLYSIGDLLYKE